MSLAHCHICGLWLRPDESCLHISPFKFAGSPPADDSAGAIRPLENASARNLSPVTAGRAGGSDSSLLGSSGGLVSPLHSSPNN